MIIVVSALRSLLFVFLIFISDMYIFFHQQELLSCEHSGGHFHTGQLELVGQPKKQILTKVLESRFSLFPYRFRAYGIFKLRNTWKNITSQLCTQFKRGAKIKARLHVKRGGTARVEMSTGSNKI